MHCLSMPTELAFGAMSTLGQASVTALLQYLRFAQAQGMSADEILAAQQLPASILEDDNARISGKQFQGVLEFLLANIDTPILGLLSGDYVQPSSYNVLGYITMSCTTLGEVIARIAPFEKLVGDMGTTHINAQQHEIHLHWQCQYPNPKVREQMVDNVFSSWINYAYWLGNTKEHHPLRVELQRCAPEDALLNEYTKRWQCPVLFEQAADKIIIDPNLLNVPIQQGNSNLRQTLEQHAQKKLAELEQSSSTSLLTLDSHALSLFCLQQIYQSLTIGKLISQEGLSQRCQLSKRTLQRKLAEQDTSYQQLVDQQRSRLAQELLAAGKEAKRVAEKLGFTELSSFHRSFKRWTGQTPGQYQQAQRLI